MVAVDVILAEIGEALKVLLAQKGWTCVEDAEAAASKFLPSEYALLCVDEYAQLLRSIAKAKGSLKHRAKLAKDVMLDKQATRLCAALRAYSGLMTPPGPALIFDRASQLSVWKPLREQVRSHLEPKAKGGHRVITKFGPMRRAQCLIVRDMLLVLGIDGFEDFNKKGGGGERALVKSVCDSMTSGTEWWWSADVKSYYASIRPGHFGWLPIDKRLLKNVFFLPKCAKIIVTKVAGNDPLVETTTTQMVRQGLPQGSLLSPLLARALLEQTLNGILDGKSVKVFRIADDFIMGSASLGSIKDARQSVTVALSSLPAGPIELHSAPIHASKSGRVSVLGYRLIPGKGYGPNSVHVKPAFKRISKFKRRLKVRLDGVAAGEDHFAVAEIYWSAWYGSQAAWTKVPYHSRRLSQFITETYVEDYLHGLPMGCGVISH